MPIGFQLETVADLKQSQLIEVASDELQADRQSSYSEPARNTQRRGSGQVCRVSVPPDRTQDAASGVWLGRAHAMLECLCRDYLARGEKHRGILKHGCYSKPHNEGIDSAVLFGDFYFSEALCKSVLLGRLRDVPVRMVVT